MDSPAYLARRVQYGVRFWQRNADLVRPEGARVMEIGTGWDAIHTILLAALGVESITTFDHLPHLRFPQSLSAVRSWRTQSDTLSDLSGQPAARINARLDEMLRSRDLDSLLKSMRATYVAPADICNTNLSQGSFDIIYGYAVLAHLPRPILHSFCGECGRLLAPGGLSVQRIGLEDPFNDWKGGDCVDFLRLSPRLWRLLGEHSVMYHNRLRGIEHIRAFEAAGAVIVRAQETVKPRDLERVRSMRLAEPFRGFTPEQLAASELDLICQFGRSGTRDTELSLANPVARSFGAPSGSNRTSAEPGMR
jgi:SAM-dependent methyltransferase